MPDIEQLINCIAPNIPSLASQKPVDFFKLILRIHTVKSILQFYAEILLTPIDL